MNKDKERYGEAMGILIEIRRNLDRDLEIYG